MMERFAECCPEMPAHFAERIEKTLDMLSEDERVLRISLKLVTAVCIIVVLISVVGFAAVKHNIFGWIFTREEPDEAAESMAVEVNEMFSGKKFDVIIEEYVFDGSDLYVSWRVDVKDEGDFILIGSGLMCENVEFRDNDLQAGFGNYQFVIDDERFVSGMNKGHFYDDTTEDEVYVSMKAALLKPFSDIEKYDYEFLMDWYSRYGEEIDGWGEKLELMEETSYGSLEEDMEIKFGISAKEHMQKAIAEEEIIDILDFQVKLTDVDFTGINAKIRWEFVDENPEKYENIDYQIWIDGADSGFACMRDDYSVEFWSERGYAVRPEEFEIVPGYYRHDGKVEFFEIEGARIRVSVRYE